VVEVDAAGQQLGEQRRRLGDHTEDDAIQVRPAAELLRKAGFRLEDPYHIVNVRGNSFRLGHHASLHPGGDREGKGAGSAAAKPRRQDGSQEELN
jgi:hypothetical protein